MQSSPLLNESFGVSVSANAPIFAERAMYSDAAGTTWAAGSAVTATRLP